MVKTGMDRIESERRIAAYYDIHHGRLPEDLDFWTQLANQQGGPILELGCGTGRVLLPLARAGHSILGLDRNFAMLARLKDKLRPEPASRIHIMQADLTAFRLAKRFALVFLACNTFSALPDGDRMRCLENASAHLAPAGLFAASLPNPALLADLPDRSDAEVEEVFPDPETGEPVQVSSGWERDQKGFHLSWHYDRLSVDGHVERLTIRTTHTVNDRQTYLKELARAGLRAVAEYGDYDFSAYRPNSPHLIITASS
jgi:SAM-dependent methyltransferase